MARYHLHHSLDRRTVIRHFYRLTRKHFSTGRICVHQKVSDAMLMALPLSRLVFNVPYASMWWSMVSDTRPGLPSHTQAYTRSAALLERLEGLANTPERLAEMIIDSMPLPVCRPKRIRRCAFPGVRWRYGTQGSFYGYKLHAWVTPAGQIVQYRLRPANLHDLTVGDELNQQWPAFGGPKLIGDKSYACLGVVFPPKINTRHDTGWREHRHPRLQKRIETVFSQLVAGQIRSVQAKTLTGLRLRVVLAVLAHNLSRP